jgi:hypothetical protein
MLNQGLLSSTGSKETINWSNPRRSDFWSFKAAGHNVGVIGPMLGVVRLLAKMGLDATESQTKMEKSGIESRSGRAGSDLMQYGENKMSPFANFMWQAAFSQDPQGRPTPWSSDQVSSRLQKEGVTKPSYGQYALSTFLPIPFEEGIKEVWMSQGMNKSQADMFYRFVISAGATATTGARVEPDIQEAPKQEPHKEPFQIRTPRLKGVSYNQGQIINRGGKQYLISGFDTDGTPLVEEVSNNVQNQTANSENHHNG